MFSSTRSITGVSEAKQPLGLHAFARVIMVLAWAAFWFNSALFPCREAVAATFSGHSDDASQSVSAARPAHASDKTYCERSHHSPDSPCDCTLDAGSAISGAYAGLATDRAHLEWFAIDVSVPVVLTGVNHSANLALREYHPPSPFRLYLHTQRLLI